VKSKEKGKNRVKVEPADMNVVGSDFEDKSRAGRPNLLYEEKLEELLSVYYSRPYSLRQLADMFGVSRMTVWRAVQTAAAVQVM